MNTLFQTITSIISPDWAAARSESSSFQSCKMSCSWPEVQKITTEHCLQMFFFKLMLLIYLYNPNEPSQCFKPSTQGQNHKGSVGMGEALVVKKCLTICAT